MGRDHLRNDAGGGRQPMPIACWPTIHRTASTLVHAAHPLRRLVHRGLHRLARHAAHATVRPAHTWVSFACKAVPAALAGGGLLVAPVAANDPPAPQPSIHYVQPMPPVLSPWSGFGQTGLMPVQLPETPPAITLGMPEIVSALPPLTPESYYPVTPFPPSTPGSPSDPSPPDPSVPEPGSLADLLIGAAILLLVRQLAAASRAQTHRS